MKRHFVALVACSVCLITLGVVQHGAAQTVGHIDELTQSVKPGDRIIVTDLEGQQTEGRFVHVSPDALTMMNRREEFAVPANAIGRIEKRDSLVDGTLIGAASLGFLGAGFAGLACASPCAREITLTTLGFGAIGATAGALIDRKIHGYSPLYGPPLDSPQGARREIPLSSFDMLWSRVREGDTIEVIDTEGRQITGQFARVSGSVLFLRVYGQPREVPASRVRRVTRKGNQYRMGLATGAVLGVIVGAASSHSEAAVGTGLSFGAFGAIIGTSLPRRLIVYETADVATSASVGVIPLLGSHSRGVALSVAF